MRKCLAVHLRVQLPRAPLRRPALDGRENRRPASVFLIGDFRVGSVGRVGRLQGGLLAVVTDEEAGVDFDAVDVGAGDAQLDDGPVVGGGVVAAGFPAVVPGSCVDEDAGAVDGRGRGEEVGGGGEVFVGAGEDGAVEGGGGEVGGVGEGGVDLIGGDVV